MALRSFAWYAVLGLSTTVCAQQQPAPLAAMPEAQVVDVESPVASVTLYAGRAAVTRRASLDLQPGVYDLRLANLPESVQPQSLQARTDEGLRVLSVDFAEEAAADAPSLPRLTELNQRFEELSQALREAADERELIKSQEAFLDALTIRTTSDASAALGAERLDLDVLQKQMQFLAAQRGELQKRRRDVDARQAQLERELAAVRENRDALASRAAVMRTAVISVVAAQAFSGEVALTYLVANATWEPAYNVRASTDLSSTQIEYDAILTQRTGEDWNDVRLTLSTAQPTLAANPPSLPPWYIDIARPMPARSPGLAMIDKAEMEFPMSRAAASEQQDERLQSLARDAEVAGGGPSVTFELPRLVTVRSNVQRQQRTRIAGFDSPAAFVHVATPLLGEAVYLRGELTNASAYQLLPGRTSIFFGQDYIGPTNMPAVAPGGLLQMHFGIDRGVRVQRQIVGKTTENTGLLSGGRRTSYDYRISIDNGTGRDITLELWDRVPVSRTGEIQVQLVNPSVRLADDSYYATNQQPQGLLKWWLTIPASARDRGAASITWSVRIDRAKDVQVTGLPE